MRAPARALAIAANASSKSLGVLASKTFRPPSRPFSPVLPPPGTDNGNLILDCHGFSLLDPPKIEAELNNIAGVVTNGIFARRPADVLLLGEQKGVRTLSPK